MDSMWVDGGTEGSCIIEAVKGEVEEQEEDATLGKIIKY